MLRFEIIMPETIDECLDALASCGGEGAILAGGTDLHILMEAGMKQPRTVVSVGKIGELRTLSDTGGDIQIGAAVTHAELAGSGLLAELECLRIAAASIGSPQIRNMATVGGNIANASPAGDLFPPLLVMDAVVHTRSPGGRREIRLEELPTGPGMTTLLPDEIITHVRFGKPEGRFYSGFMKIGLRNALAISVASAAMFATLRDGGFGEVRIACGAVAPRPIRLRQVESLIEGKRPSKDIVVEAGTLASRECDPVTDLRATRDYRSHVTGVIVSRLVMNARRHLMGESEAR
jgi:CO/xanthine dehydrogenase FAD-binding subunit